LIKKAPVTSRMKIIGNPIVVEISESPKNQVPQDIKDKA
jgi:hypothetical protein